MTGIFPHATAVTRGWNGYRNKSQHRKSTMEKKILLPFLQGFKPATFQSRVRRSNHWAIPWHFHGHWIVWSSCYLQKYTVRHPPLFVSFKTNGVNQLLVYLLLYFLLLLLLLLSIFLHLTKTVESACVSLLLVFRRIGEYISLDLF